MTPSRRSTPLADRLRRHRKDTRFIVGALALLLAALVAIFYLLQGGRDLPDFLVGNQVLLFALWYVNVVLILAVLFVLLRNLFKLAIERRHRILGSKFKIKLVASYIGLSLIPVLLLFAYATELLQGTVDRWVSSPQAETFAQANRVVEALYQRLEADGLRAADEGLAAIAGLDLQEPGNRPELGRRFQRVLTANGLDYLAVYDGTEFVHGVVDPRAGISDLPEPGRRFLSAALAGESRRRILPPASSGGGRLMLLAAVEPEVAAQETTETAETAETEAGPPPAPRRSMVVAGLLLEPEVVGATEELLQAYQGHRQLVVQKDALKASHLLIFLMVTLLILLASSWVGLYLARRITVPIQALAEGTEVIREGNLSHRVEVEADDELGVLVTSFNRMTGQLERSRTLVERSNRELVETNARLAEERALAAAVIDNVAAGVIAIDPEGRILTANEVALGMLRQRREDVLGRRVEEAWDDPERSKLAALLTAAEPADRPGATSARDLLLVLGGEWKSFEVKVTPMIAGSGELRGRVMVLEDLTELIKAQQLAAWNEAARRIAHEIKNPLTPIKLAAERILQKYRRGDDDLGPALEAGVEILLREVETMQEMVDEFSRYARMPRPQPTEVDLARLVEETLRLYRGLKPGVEVTSRIPPEATGLVLDPEQIKRVLINLLDNAVEATEAPGRVEVAARVSDGHVAIDVADTGRGIDAEAKEKLFLPYFSTKGRGTGLGLAIVHRIVSDHRGTIRVEDNRPQGTVFTIELPAG